MLRNSLTPASRLVGAVFVSAALVFASACGSDSESSEPNDSPSTTEQSGDGTTESSSAYPVTIEHAFGSTTVESAPKRIVTVGYLDHDSVLALGEVPVATTEWFGEHPGAIFPWATDEFEATGEELPEVLTLSGDGADLEVIAAQEPDLILAVYSGLTDEQYQGLSAIAPTVAQPEEYPEWGAPWDVVTLTVGKALGKEGEAQALVDDVKEKIDQTAAKYPQFVGKTGIVAVPYEGIFVYGPADSRGRFLESIGLTLPEGIVEATGADWGGNLSLENVELLDTDVIVWLDADTVGGEADAGPIGGPVYQALAVHTEGRELLLQDGDPLADGMSFLTVLSYPMLLDDLVPQIAQALEGNAAN